MELVNTLPKKLYDVRIPILATYTDDELENSTIGLDTINGKVKDDSVMELTTVMINIDRMIDIYSRGFPIYIVKKDDVTDIYKTLTEYVSSTSPDHRYVLNRPKVVEERMGEIDKFLEEMFGHNKHTIVKKTINADNGYNIAQGLMQYRPIEGYALPSDTQTSMIQNNVPDVDINKVKRVKNTFRESYT